MELNSSPKLNQNPIIGVVLRSSLNQPLKDILHRCILREVPGGGWSSSRTDCSVNGVLFPGGSINLVTSGYARVSRLIFDLAKEANDEGDYFPLWGTCLGFQLLACVVGHEEGIRLSHTHTLDVALPLNFTEEAKESRMFKDFPKNTLRALAKEPVTANSHKYSVSTWTYKNNESLKAFYRVLTTNRSDKGKRFISTMEAYKYPFYGVQWHPEKSQFEWTGPTSHTRLLPSKLLSAAQTSLSVKRGKTFTDLTARQKRGKP
ncbi:hypothetical protein WMY93_029667 [Mugilogobius chulae]|uniref:folate gamma-glutamyl hydrolase n=1 Tax=Mugilogobius chulae TaxID=88201 RepID=A0AAW0MSE9_9GOBI